VPAELRQGALDLALAVARKIVHAELEASAEATARVIDAAVRHAQDAAVVRVRVNPADKERIEAAHPAGARPELAADPAVAPGGCVVETDCGDIDATVETQWQIIRSAILAEAERDEHSTEDAAPLPSGAADEERTPE
jgi:flagellar assembly protein FliH